MTKQAAPRSKKSLLLGLALLAVIGAGFAAHQLHLRAGVVAALPPSPALSGRPAILSERLSQAGRTAQGFSRPLSGLAELARLYAANGSYPEALGCYAALQRLQPGEARWWHLAATLHASFGRIDEALPLWRRTIELAPAYLPARIRLGDILLKSNRAAEAAEVYEAALTVAPRQPYALLGLARGRTTTGDWRGARDFLQTAVQADPDFIGALSLLVTVQEKLGATAEARRLQVQVGKREFTDIPDPWLEELTDDCFDAYRLSVAAAVERHRGNPARARALLERAVDLAPDAGNFRRQLAQLLFKMRDPAAARRQLEKAVVLAPTDTDAWLLLVEVLTALRLPADAERALIAGLGANPGSSALHLLRGRRVAAAGRLAEAAAEFSLAKQLRPSEADAYVELALVHFQQDHLEAGLAELQAALVVQPGHILAMQILARHAISTGDEAAARRWLALLRESARVAADDLAVITEEYRQQFRHAPW